MGKGIRHPTVKGPGGGEPPLPGAWNASEATSQRWPGKIGSMDKAWGWAFPIRSGEVRASNLVCYRGADLSALPLASRDFPPGPCSAWRWGEAKLYLEVLQSGAELVPLQLTSVSFSPSSEAEEDLAVLHHLEGGRRPAQHLGGTRWMAKLLPMGPPRPRPMARQLLGKGQQQLASLQQNPSLPRTL